jgi:Phosphodiester glycosidase
MRKSALILLSLFLSCSGMLLPAGAEVQPSGPPWKELAPGLSFYRWPVQSGSQAVLDVITILRLKPDQWSFKVFYSPTPKTIQEWRLATNAPIVCNGGFYQEDFKPAGRILVNGVSIGPLKNRSMKGMFLAEPKKGFEQIPKARLIDLKEENSEETVSKYDQGIQSFPILLDPRGQVRVNPSNFQANRTVIAQDRQGNILVLVTEKPYFTLYGLGQYLKRMPLSLSFALNLDGGNRTQLTVQIKDFSYKHTGLEGTPEASLLFFPEGNAKLPSVIGIFPRGGAF